MVTERAKRDVDSLLVCSADSGMRVGRHQLCGWVEAEGKTPRIAESKKMLPRFGGHCWRTFAGAAQEVFGEDATAKKNSKTPFLTNVRLKGKLVL